MSTIKYTIPAISCGHCKMNIERELDEMEGVASVLVTVDDKQAAIGFEAPATVEKIEALLTEIGYPPQGS